MRRLFDSLVVFLLVPLPQLLVRQVLNKESL